MRKLDYKCPVCGCWIATVYKDDSGAILTSACSSEFVSEDEPCEDCQREQSSHQPKEGGGHAMTKVFEIHYVGNYGSVVIRTINAKDEAEALKKASEYCDNVILRVMEVQQ